MSIPPAEDPFIVTLDLKPVPQAPTLARHTIAAALESWGFDAENVYVGKLVASELVTNAVAVSSEGQEIVLRTFIGDDGRPIVEVWG